MQSPDHWFLDISTPSGRGCQQASYLDNYRPNRAVLDRQIGAQEFRHPLDAQLGGKLLRSTSISRLILGKKLSTGTASTWEIFASRPAPMRFVPASYF